MAPEAAFCPQPHLELRLTLDVFTDAVALRASTGSWKLALVGHAQQGPPGVGGRVLRGGLGARRRDGRQVQRLAWRALDLRRIYEPIPANPHVIVGPRQIGHEVPSPVIRDDDL